MITDAHLEQMKPYICSHHALLELAADEIAPLVGCSVAQVQQVLDEDEQYMKQVAEWAQWREQQDLIAYC